MDNQTKWAELLQQAVSQPGMILKAYSAFHGYSLGNQIAAMIQCEQRGIEAGPINTYPGWQKLNRQVKKGQKAIWLCMPFTKKLKNETSGEDQTIITNFVWKPHWFVLSQTDGEPVEMPAIPDPMTQTSVSTSLSSRENWGRLEYGSVCTQTGSFFPDVFIN